MHEHLQGQNTFKNVKWEFSCISSFYNAMLWIFTPAASSEDFDDRHTKGAVLIWSMESKI